MNDFDLSQALHVADSDSAAPLLLRAFGLSRDQVLINEDPISCGPAPVTDDLNAWRSLRESYLRDMYLEWPDFSFDEYGPYGLLMNLERLGQGRPVVVWVALGLAEQLLLAWVVFLFERLGLDPSNLSVVQFERLKSRQRVLSMGELSPENIRNYSPEPRHLTSEEMDELRRVWRVYTNSDAAALSRYVAEIGPMPVLHRAVSQLVYRYPDVRSGLGVWDERLLHYTMEEGPGAARVVGYSLVCSEAPDQVGDSYLFRRLIAQGSAELASPLISITGSRRAMRECEARLTSFGQKVLAGEANHVRENGIDDWVGGVHLSNEGSVTFRQGGSLVHSRGAP